MRFRVVTYNIGGGSRTPEPALVERLPAIGALVKSQNADIVALQEAPIWLSADGNDLDASAEVARLSHLPFHEIRCPITMKRNFSDQNAAMVAALLAGYSDWQIGIAMLSRRPFVKMDPSGGSERVVGFPVHRTPSYQGSRDTEWRDVMLGRFQVDGRYLAAFSVHFTTLRGEQRTDPASPITAKARQLRGQQAETLGVVLQAYRDKNPNDFIVVFGDFNEPDVTSPCMKKMESLALVRLGPDGDIPTHLGQGLVVDHVFTDAQLAKHLSAIQVVTNDDSASDHRPVVAEFDL